MKRESKHLLSLTKALVPKETFAKIKDIQDEDELRHAAIYSAVSRLEQSHHLLNKEIKKDDPHKMFFARNKCDLMGIQVKFLKHDFSVDSLKKTIELRHDVWREINGAV
jgi:hypothetical protein